MRPPKEALWTVRWDPDDEWTPLVRAYVWRTQHCLQAVGTGSIVGYAPGWLCHAARSECWVCSDEYENAASTCADDSAKIGFGAR